MQASNNFVPPIIDLPWTTEEHNLFLQGYLLYGKSWVQIAEVVRSRNAYQVCSYATWLESHGCLPRLPPIQNAVPIQPAAPIQNAAPTQPAVKPTAPKQKNGIAQRKGTWQKEEHQLFLEGVERYGQGRWTAISKVVGTRNPAQVLSHAKSHFGYVPSRKRKASNDEKPKAKKKLAATSPKKSPARPSSKASSGVARSPKAVSEAKPVASTTPKVAGDTKVEEPNHVKSDATPEPPNKSEGDSTVDIQPPSIKIEDVGEGVVSPPVKEIKALGGDETTTKLNSIEPTDSSPQIPSDHEELKVSPPLYKFDSRMKIPIIAIGMLVSILLVGTIIVYMGPEVGEITYDENPLEL